MSYLNQKATIGRIVKRPNEVVENEEDTGDGIKSLQLMTESLRSKIHLKERYNKALLDELQESKAGASQMVLDLVVGNEEMRVERQEAIVADVAAGTKAIRSMRDMQLALKGRRPCEILDWLEDQLGDLRKKIDRATHKMKILRFQLKESENIVVELEQSPICGSGSWEIEAEKRLIELCVKISERETKMDSAKILNSKYKEIQTSLRDQKGKWPIEVKQVQVLVDKFKIELEDLENMLADALRLRDLAKYRCEITQEEFTVNRQVRKKQLTFIKRQVEKAMADNVAKYAIPDANKGRPPTNMIQATPAASQLEAVPKTAEILKQKQADVAIYEAKARTLVDAMHVPDMRHCPKRLAKLWSLRDELFEAAEFKYNLRGVLTKQKANLTLILCHLRFTGGLEEEEFTGQMKEMQDVIKEADARQKITQNKIQSLENHAVDWETAVVGIDDLLNQGKGRTKHQDHEDIVASMKLINIKLNTLLNDIKAIREALPTGKEDDEPYKQFVKSSTPKNACRISTVYNEGGNDAAVEDDDEDEFHMSSIDVPTADDIKTRSKRIAKQGRMRRGIKLT